MSFTTITFIFFAVIMLLLYYIVPLNARWMILTIGSVSFYLFAGWQKLFFVLATALIAWIVSNRIETIYTSQKFETLSSVDKKAKAKGYLITGVLLVLLSLLYAKIGQSVVDALINIGKGGDFVVKIIIPLGISYYTFGIVGYMADVYWRKDKAEKNYFKLLLYMIYFPQILQGPIPRHKRLASQLIEGHAFEYDRFCFGLQRMVWGYFKKLVIADRFGIIVNTVFHDYVNYDGQYFVIAILASAIQLYCDFSGCMDIALGMSECLGITLDENFNRPFFARSAAEFWRRWHITLGTWFKDYIYMPMVINPKLIGFSKKVKDKFGTRAGKSLMSSVPLAIVWLLTGLWHGTGADYVIWGCYWGIIIICTTVFAPEIKKINKKLNINTDSKGWSYFQMVRTFLIFCGGRLLTAPGNLKVTGYVIKSIFSNFNIWIWFDRSLYTLGLDRQDFWIGVLSIAFLWFISIKQEKGIRIRESIASWPLPIRWTVYYGGVFAILVFGMYGSGYDASSFVYMQY